MRLVRALALSVLTASGAAAVETVTCADAGSEIGFSYVFDYRQKQPVLSVTMQLTDDFGLSTDPGHADHDGEYVSEGFAGDGFEGGTVSWDDADGRRHQAMRFRIGCVSEAQRGIHWRGGCGWRGRALDRQLHVGFRIAVTAVTQSRFRDCYPMLTSGHARFRIRLRPS